jgi:hypothetical protein
MTVALDQMLLFRTRRRNLPPETCIAINLFWRDGVKASILAKAFNVSKNTIYYQCLTGDAKSYPASPDTNTARQINKVIDSMGVKAAWRRFVTDSMVRAVNAEMAVEVERQNPANKGVNP